MKRKDFIQKIGKVGLGMGILSYKCRGGGYKTTQH